ncbi:hypothetical protein D1872_286320 [compost metagenome]
MQEDINRDDICAQVHHDGRPACVKQVERVDDLECGDLRCNTWNQGSEQECRDHNFLALEFEPIQHIRDHGTR